MRKLVSMFMAMAIFAVLSLGCAGVSKEAQVKCPKCGAVFTVNEGIDEYRGRSGTGR